MADPDLAAWLEYEDARIVPIVGSCSIGRAPTNHLVLADDRVSRKHALIHRQGDDEYWLVDLGSSNGSYLDGRRVSQPVALRDGMVIRIGACTLRFRQISETSPEGAESLGAPGTILEIRVAPCWLLLADIEGSTELARELTADKVPVVIGKWFSECKQVLETNGGVINKYLGDGFFAYWPATLGTVEAVLGGLLGLKMRQAAGPPHFRVVLHHGVVSMGGAATMGEENLSGPEVNFIFRMEKLAGGLGIANLMSAAAHEQLAGRLAGTPVGRHPLSGFEGEFDFLSF